MSMVESNQVSTLERSLRLVNERFDQKVSNAQTTSQIRQLERERSDAKAEICLSHGRSSGGGMVE